MAQIEPGKERDKIKDIEKRRLKGDRRTSI